MGIHNKSFLFPTGVTLEGVHSFGLILPEKGLLKLFDLHTYHVYKWMFVL
ncbi:hypothetical protein SRABI84_02790 [Peribacillus simplex]|nr:hypothetical protein SRABI84_02790 [Peribacillus simplex]